MTTTDADQSYELHALRYNLAVSCWQPRVQAAIKAILFGRVPYHGNTGLLRDHVFLISNFGAGVQDWHGDLRAVHCGKREVLRGRTSTIIERDPALGGKTSVVYNSATLELIETPERFDANPPSLRLLAQNLQTETGNKGAGKGNNGAKAIVFAANRLDRTQLGTLARVVDSHLDLLNHCMPLPPTAESALETFCAALCRVACIPRHEHTGAAPNAPAAPLDPLSSHLEGIRTSLIVRHSWYAFTRALFQVLSDPTGSDLVSGSRRLQLLDSKREVVRFSTAEERAAALAATPRTFDAMIVLRSLKNLFGNDFIVDQAGTERERHGFPVSAGAPGVLFVSLNSVLRAVHALVSPHGNCDDSALFAVPHDVDRVMKAAVVARTTHDAARSSSRSSPPPQQHAPKPKPKTIKRPAAAPRPNPPFASAPH